MARRVLPAEAVAAFERGLPIDERVTRRAMFGCPCAFANGAMFMGVHSVGLFLRLGAEDRARMMGEHGAVLFDPGGGRPMREYVVLPDAVLRDDTARTDWIARGLAYALTVPATAKRAPRRAPGRT
jgi:hypothetical protein